MVSTCADSEVLKEQNVKYYLSNCMLASVTSLHRTDCISDLQGNPRSVLVFLNVHWDVIRLAHPHKPLAVQTPVNHIHQTQLYTALMVHFTKL